MFMAVNLPQSAFTRWCPMEDILKKTLSLKSEGTVAGGKTGTQLKSTH